MYGPSAWCHVASPAVVDSPCASRITWRARGTSIGGLCLPPYPSRTARVINGQMTKETTTENAQPLPSPPPPIFVKNYTLRKGRVCFSFPMPIVISSTCTGCTFSIFSSPTQSKISLITSDGFCSFFNSFRSFACLRGWVPQYAF